VREQRFDPRHLTPDASLNRTRLAALPGANPEWVGRSAFELLSLQALRQLSRTAANLAEERVVTEFGRRLAHLIATLTTAARSETPPTGWRADYLRYWTDVDEVWLAGGLAAAFGLGLLTAVRTEMARLVGGGRTVRLAAHPDLLPLIGGFRSCHDARTGMVALDFGQTLVKRGMATVVDGQLVRIEVLPPRSTSEVRDVAEFVVDVIAETIRLAGSFHKPTHPCVPVALASYVAAGRPVASGKGLYAQLAEVDSTCISSAVSHRSGIETHVRFVHDGSAAALGVCNPSIRSAVIMLGTALGVGFPPPASPLLLVSSDLVVAR
jgi:hypothetical protein